MSERLKNKTSTVTTMSYAKVTSTPKQFTSEEKNKLKILEVRLTQTINSNKSLDTKIGNLHAKIATLEKQLKEERDRIHVCIECEMFAREESMYNESQYYESRPYYSTYFSRNRGHKSYY